MAKKNADVQLEAFREAAQSLKLYRRAELRRDDGEALIETLYVDPLPREHALALMLKPTTTFLVGRKGTGKSTIFQRAQHDLRRKSGVVTAYVDIKTVYEAAQANPSLVAKATSASDALPRESVEQLLLYRSFVKAVIREVRVEVRKQISQSVWQRLRRRVGGTIDDLFRALDEIEASFDDEQFVSVVGTRSARTSDTATQTVGGSQHAEAGVEIGPSPTVHVGAGAAAEYGTTSEQATEYAELLMRMIDLKGYILRLKTTLETVGISRLFVFVDDFSELPHEAMQVVVDSLLAPLNNWSDELVKFKIAAYPGRIYYGDIDKSKVDELTLDIYSLYGTSDLAVMEEKAVDFTKRLIQRRLSYYGKDSSLSAVGVTAKDEDAIWRQLFAATMGNPRNLGYILLFVYETHLIYGRPLTVTAIGEAAQRYYEEKIEAYFQMNRFLQESFDERSSIFSLKELLEDIVERARGLRNSPRVRELVKGNKRRLPTSHFHVAIDLDGLLATLELNFFMTKYWVLADRDGRKVSVFALNYGLCQQNSIEFGRPADAREPRKYYQERVFDYTSLLQLYLQTNQEIRCTACGAAYENEQLAALIMFDMLCPKCKRGQCEVRNLSRRYAEVLQTVDQGALLPRIDLGMIHALGTDSTPLSALDVAGELDCSYQMIGKRGKNLADRGLVHREGDRRTRRFSLTKDARLIYFDGQSAGPPPER